MSELQATKVADSVMDAVREFECSDTCFYLVYRHNMHWAEETLWQFVMDRMYMSVHRVYDSRDDE